MPQTSQSRSAIAADLSGARGAADSRRQGPGDPFDLANERAYRIWREEKLASFPRDSSELVVPVRDFAAPSVAEYQAIADRCARTNMAVYSCQRWAAGDRQLRLDLLAFSDAFGLSNLEGHRSAGDDGVVALEVASEGSRRGYIPYTDKPLSWHTDGYYNGPDARVRSFILHCVRNAATGGENRLLDPEIAYIRLRDENPNFIAALMRPDAMAIPANVEEDGRTRPESVGPVFFIDAATGRLQMRYTARKRNVSWLDDSGVRAAAGFLTDLLAGGEPNIFTIRLGPGQGLICNNVLHCRSAFQDGEAEMDGRLIFRLRFLDRVSDTQGGQREGSEEREARWPI